MAGLNLPTYLKGEDKVEKNNANDKEGTNWKFNSVILKNIIITYKLEWKAQTNFGLCFFYF
jgi:hypothetical protein